LHSKELEALGWDAFFAEPFEEYESEGLVPARIAVAHHGAYSMLAEQGPLGGLAAGALEERPVVGDWVAADVVPGERKAIIRAVLPRRTAFVRKEAWRRVVAQVVCANVDVVFLVCGLDGDFNVRRLERYLTAAWESGARPVIVLTKSDLAGDLAACVGEAEAVGFGVAVYAVSNVSGEGLDELEGELAPGRTVALLGSSGVGKSTLINRLLGFDRLKTGGLRRDGRGRHTTTHRELVQLPSGVILLDTPGMRELQLWADEDSLDEAFADVAELAAQCRFSDCAHETEPGCAIRAALAEGTLPVERFESHRKLQRELRALAIRQDARLRSEQRKRWRQLHRARRVSESW
jgi:ribosome biogenesis GTPase